MLNASQLYNKPVFVPKERRSSRGYIHTEGETNEELSYRKIGRVHMPVFTPDGKRVAGFLIKRSDIALMVKRKDIFIGIDSVTYVDKGLRATRGNESFDDVARKRLELRWDTCVMLTGMDVKTTNGHDLGYVSDVAFDEKTGKVSVIFVSDDRLARQLVGSLAMPPSMLRAYKSGCVLVDPAAGKLRPSGGIAARAGEASAKVAWNAKKAQGTFDEHASAAIDKRSLDFGRMIGRTRRAFKEASGRQDSMTGIKEQTPARKAQHVVVQKPASHGAIDGELTAPSKRKTFAPVNSAPNTVARGRSADKQKSHPQAAVHKKSATNSARKAVAKKQVSQKRSVTHNATQVPSARDKAARALGRQIGQVATMFSDTADEYKKARK